MSFYDSNLILLYAVKADDFQRTNKIMEDHGLILDDSWTDYEMLIHALQNENKKIIMLLLNYGCRVKRKSKTNKYFTPVYYAVKMCNTEIIKALIAKGASMNDKDYNTETPLHMAMMKKYFKIVDLLLSLYNVQNINPDNNDDKIHFNIACIRNNVSLIKSFVDHGMSVNSFVNFNHEQWPGFSPLHFAVNYQCVETVKLLLECGANISFQNAKQMSPLHLAYYISRVSNQESSECKRNEEIMSLILSSHLTKVVNPIDYRRVSHFHIACTRNDSVIVEKFFEAGVDINSRISFESNILGGYSPLHMAINYNHTKTVELLLKHNADINLKDATGCTALHLAVECENIEILKLLLRYSNDMSVKNDKGSTPLHRAFLNTKFQNIAIIDLLFSAHKGEMENSPNEFCLSHFHIACASNHLAVVKYFLQKGVDVNACVDAKSLNWPGYTALHFATDYNRINTVMLLLEHNANVNAIELHGLIPLNIACQQSHKFFDPAVDNLQNIDNMKDRSTEQIDIVKLLLRYESDLNSKDRSGVPLLFYAYKLDILKNMNLSQTQTRRYNKNCTRDKCLAKDIFSTQMEIINVLLSYGIDLNASDSDRNSILHLAAEDSKLINETVQIAELFLKNSANVNAKNVRGTTPLHAAAKTGFVEMVDLLLKYNADPKCTDYKSLNTPLHLTVMSSAADDAEDDKKYVKIVNLLMSKGANVNARDSYGRTALFNAARSGMAVKVLMRLLKENCDINCQDKSGMCALYIACLSNNISGITLLLDHGADINIELHKGVCLMESIYKLQNNNLRVNMDYYLDIFKILEMHIQKLKMIGLDVSANNENYYKQMKNLFEMECNLFSMMFGDRDWDNEANSACEHSENNLFVVKCNKELNLMRTTKMDNYTSLYDVIHKDSQGMSKHIHNTTFKELLDYKTLKGIFPLFGFILNSQFRKGAARYSYLEPAKESFRWLIGFNLPNSCFESIFVYLSNEDLNNLITAKFLRLKK